MRCCWLEETTHNFCNVSSKFVSISYFVTLFSFIDGNLSRHTLSSAFLLTYSTSCNNMIFHSIFVEVFKHIETISSRASVTQFITRCSHRSNLNVLSRARLSWMIEHTCKCTVRPNYCFTQLVLLSDRLTTLYTCLLSAFTSDRRQAEPRI